MIKSLSIIAQQGRVLSTHTLVPREFQSGIRVWCRRSARLLARLGTAGAMGFLIMPVVIAQDVLSPGANKDGAIEAGQATAYSFTSAPGDRLVLQVAKLSGGAGFTPRMELFTPEATRVGSKFGAVAARLDIQANAQGAYSVVVSDLNGTGAGTYRLRFIQLPGAVAVPANDEGGTLVNGDKQQGVIDVGDLDAWTLTAGAGDRIVLQIGEISGGAGFTPLIELFAPDGARLAFDSGGLAARVDVQAPVSGSYTVLVSDASPSGSGGYELHLAQIPGDFILPANDEGGILPEGVDKEGVITLGDLDPWSFASDPGFKIGVQLTKTSGGAGFTPKVEVFAPDGERKAFRQDASAPGLEFATEVSGSYVVLVSDANRTGAGGYRLRLTRMPITVAGSSELTNGITLLGDISVARNDDRYTFTASAGETIVVRVGETTAASRLVPQLRLFDPSGTLLESSAAAAAAEVSVRATNSGTFSVSVRDNNGGANTGGYRLSLAKTGSPLVVSPSDEGGAMTNGTTHVGSIETGDIDAWTFRANAGDYIVARMGEMTSALLPQLRLYDPSGALLEASAAAAAAEVSVRATNSGTFLLIAGDQTAGWTGTGNYRLSLAKTGSPLAISAADEGGALTNGATHLGAIDTGDIDAWTINANAGESIVVRMGEMTAALLPQLRLFDPSGALLDTQAAAVAAEVTVRVTNSGAFLLLAGDQTAGWAGTGNYRLTLCKTGNPLSISPSDEGGALTNATTYVGSIETGDIDAWTIDAKTGDSIVVRMGEMTSALVPQLRIYDPSGALLETAAAAVAAEVSVRATNNGTFLLIAGDQTAGWAGTGNYRLTLAKTGIPLTISPLDEGGTMINGTTYLAAIDTGGIDAWTFNANAGESIVVRMGEVTTGALTPQLRLYDPSGALLETSAAAAAAEVSARATNSGAFLVIAGDQTAGWAGTGNYRLILAKTGNPIVISAGQEGGPMNGTDAYDGALEVGALDAWSFTACQGEVITLNVRELPDGSPLTPWIRLFNKDGAELKSLSGPAVAEFTMAAPASGTYTVVVGDRTAGFAGSGTYRLTATGLSHQLRICAARSRAAGFTPIIIGGLPGGTLTLFTSTKVADPFNQWETLLTSQFDQFGVFTVTNVFDSTELQRYFQLRTP